MRVTHAVHGHVVDITTLAGDEALVFLSRHAGANTFNSHGILPWVNGELVNSEVVSAPMNWSCAF